MAGTVDKLNVRIGANISPLQKAMDDMMKRLTSAQSTAQKTASVMSGAFGGVTSSLKKVGAAIAGIVASKKLIELGKQAIEAGSDLTEVQNVVDTVFGSMSESINNWSKSAMTAFGLSETAAKKYTSTMGAMLKSSGISGSSWANAARLSANGQSKA